MDVFSLERTGTAAVHERGRWGVKHTFLRSENAEVEVIQPIRPRMRLEDAGGSGGQMTRSSKGVAEQDEECADEGLGRAVPCRGLVYPCEEGMGERGNMDASGKTQLVNLTKQM